MTVPVYLEVGARRVFAGALEWPGWIRSGRTEDQALDALAAAARRYAPVAALAGLALPETARGAPRGAGSTRAGLEVVERIRGNAATDFGVPAAIPEADRRPLTSKQARRVADLVGACWTYLDRVVAAAPAELRKGPRRPSRRRIENGRPATPPDASPGTPSTTPGRSRTACPEAALDRLGEVLEV